jgi:hypothetical protein
MNNSGWRPCPIALNLYPSCGKVIAMATGQLKMAAAISAAGKQSMSAPTMIADGVGRGLVLERNYDYKKVKQGYDAMVTGKGKKYS